MVEVLAAVEAFAGQFHQPLGKRNTGRAGGTWAIR
jgi:hypothetical protein